jgi:hypothetical protein
MLSGVLVVDSARAAARAGMSHKRELGKVATITRTSGAKKKKATGGGGLMAETAAFVKHSQGAQESSGRPLREAGAPSPKATK